MKMYDVVEDYIPNLKVKTNVKSGLTCTGRLKPAEVPQYKPNFPRCDYFKKGNYYVCCNDRK